MPQEKSQLNPHLIPEEKPGSSRKKELKVDRKIRQHSHYMPLYQKDFITGNYKMYTSLNKSHPFHFHQPQIPQSLELFEAYEQNIQKQRQTINEIENNLGVYHLGRVRCKSMNLGFNFYKTSAKRLVMGNNPWGRQRQKEYNKKQNLKKLNIKRGDLEQINKGRNL